MATYDGVPCSGREKQNGVRKQKNDDMKERKKGREKEDALS